MASTALLIVFALFAFTDAVSIVDIEKIVQTHLAQVKTEFNLYVQQLKNENIVLNSELVALKSEVSFLKSKFQSLTQTIPGEDNTDVINIKKATTNGVKSMDTPNSVDNTDLRTSVDQPSGNSSIADHISDDVKPLSDANAESVPLSQIDGITRTNVQTSDNVNADDNKSNLRHSRVSPIHGLNQVAFQAMLNHQIGSLGDDETIRFDRMQVNLGGGYNPTSGVFTCSVPGLYVFHVTAVNYSGKSFELHFMKNGQEFGRLYLGDEDNTRSDSASSTFIVELQVSDSVRIASNTNHDSGQVILPAYSFFNAFLLYPNSL